MNNAERISRHSRDYKAERPSHGRSRFRLLENTCTGRKLITVQLGDLMPHRRVSIVQRTRSSRVIFHGAHADFPAEAATLKIIRACRIAFVWLRGTSHNRTVCFLFSRSIYRPNDPFTSFVDADLPVDHVLFFPFLSLLFSRGADTKNYEVIANVNMNNDSEAKKRRRKIKRYDWRL